MKKKVAIVDYGLGNLFSIYQACEYAGLSPKITSSVNEISTSDGLILPGVGSFGDAMTNLNESNLLEPILKFAKSGKSFLGICLGMQLLFTESEEFGSHLGLDLIKGKIVKFPISNLNSSIPRVPQIQWNKIHKPEHNSWVKSVLEQNIDGDYMYFVHSYYAIPNSESNILSITNYGNIEYASSVMKDNITGIQFHPEKSAKQGLEIYKSWAKQI
jgi:glutamine amidotransferase